MKNKLAAQLFTGALTASMALSLCPATLFAATTTSYAETVTPDEDEDFNAYDISVIFTVDDDGALTDINIESTFGRKATQNTRYSTQAVTGIVSALAAGETADAVSGATCTSKAILAALEEASGDYTSVSSSLTASINGEVQNSDTIIEDDDDDDDDTTTDDSSSDDSESTGKGQSTSKGGSTITLPEGTSVTYENISAVDGVVTIAFVLPDGYEALSINLVRVGNSAYMPAKDPETCAEMFAFDADTGLMTINVDTLDGETTVTVSLQITDGTETGTTNIAVSILSESTITLSDKTADYTGEAVEIDAAVVTGSTGEVTYTYYTDESLTEALDSAPTEAGTYYVVATVAEDSEYYAASSNTAVLTINAAATTAAGTTEEDTDASSSSATTATSSEDEDTTTTATAASTTSTASASSSGDSVSTGDSSSMLLWTMGILAALGSSVAVFLKKRTS